MADGISANLAMLMRVVDRLAYVADRLSQLMAHWDAVVLVAAQLLPDSESQDRLPFVLDRIRSLIAAGRG